MTGSEKRPWTDEDLGFLEEHADWTARRIGQDLGRSLQEVNRKRRQLRTGWSRVREPWTEEELDVLLDNRWATAEQLVDKLPGRSAGAINQRRTSLGIGAGGRVRKEPTVIGARPLIAKTCTVCGKLLQADWFSFHSTLRRWSPSCRVCNSAAALARQEKSGLSRNSEASAARSSKSKRSMQALTLSRASNHRKPWSERDHEVLADPDLTRLQKALRLGRTFAATANACARNGYKSHNGLGEPEDLWVIFNPNAPEQAA